MTHFPLQKQIVMHYCYQELFNARTFFPLNFTSEDAAFHGLSESGLSFLGHRYKSALLAKILKKISVKNHQNVLYFEFFTTKMGLYWNGFL